MSPSILDRIGHTPLVPLARIAPNVFGKCEFLNPGGSGKDRIALAIVDDAERRGLLKRGDTLVEATAGNTGLGLALVAAVRGYKLVCVLPAKMSADKRAALAAAGTERTSYSRRCSCIQTRLNTSPGSCVHAEPISAGVNRRPG